MTKPTKLSAAPGDEYSALVGRIAARNLLKVEIATALSARERANHDAREISEHLKDARNAIAGIRPLDGPKKSALIQSAIDRLQCELEEATARKNAVDIQLSALRENEHATLTTSAVAITEHRETLATASARAGKIRALLDACDDQNNGFDDPRQAISEHRSDLLAAVAMGDASAADLATFDQAHAAEVKAAAAKAEQYATARGDADAARAGLLRKLKGAQAEVARLEALTPAVRSAFLSTELMTAHQIYTAAAEAEVHARGRLQGLQELLRRDGGQPVTTPPTLKPPHIDDCAAAEVERLSEAGVALF